MIENPFTQSVGRQRQGPMPRLSAIQDKTANWHMIEIIM
jgi:hypothetical protein